MEVEGAESRGRNAPACPLPCSLSSLLTMNCRARAEGIARRLQTHLRTPGATGNCSSTENAVLVTSEWSESPFASFHHGRAYSVDDHHIDTFHKTSDLHKLRPIHVVTSEPTLHLCLPQPLHELHISPSDHEQDSDVHYDFDLVTPEDTMKTDHISNSNSPITCEQSSTEEPKMLSEDGLKGAEKPESGCVTSVTSPVMFSDEFEINPSYTPPVPDLEDSEDASKISDANLEAVREILSTSSLHSLHPNFDDTCSICNQISIDGLLETKCTESTTDICCKNNVMLQSKGEFSENADTPENDSRYRRLDSASSPDDNIVTASSPCKKKRPKKKHKHRRSHPRQSSKSESSAGESSLELQGHDSPSGFHEGSSPEEVFSNETNEFRRIYSRESGMCESIDSYTLEDRLVGAYANDEYCELCEKEALDYQTRMNRKSASENRSKTSPPRKNKSKNRHKNSPSVSPTSEEPKNGKYVRKSSEESYENKETEAIGLLKSNLSVYEEKSNVSKEKSHEKTKKNKNENASAIEASEETNELCTGADMLSEEDTTRPDLSRDLPLAQAAYDSQCKRDLDAVIISGKQSYCESEQLLDLPREQETLSQPDQATASEECQGTLPFTEPWGLCASQQDYYNNSNAFRDSDYEVTIFDTHYSCLYDGSYPLHEIVSPRLAAMPETEGQSKVKESQPKSLAPLSLSSGYSSQASSSISFSPPIWTSESTHKDTFHINESCSSYEPQASSPISDRVSNRSKINFDSNGHMNGRVADELSQSISSNNKPVYKPKQKYPINEGGVPTSEITQENSSNSTVYNESERNKVIHNLQETSIGVANKCKFTSYDLNRDKSELRDAFHSSKIRNSNKSISPTVNSKDISDGSVLLNSVNNSDNEKRIPPPIPPRKKGLSKSSDNQTSVHKSSVPPISDKVSLRNGSETSMKQPTSLNSCTNDLQGNGTASIGGVDLDNEKTASIESIKSTKLFLKMKDEDESFRSGARPKVRETQNHQEEAVKLSKKDSHAAGKDERNVESLLDGSKSLITKEDSVSKTHAETEHSVTQAVLVKEEEEQTSDSIAETSSCSANDDEEIETLANDMTLNEKDNVDEEDEEEEIILMGKFKNISKYSERVRRNSEDDDGLPPPPIEVIVYDANFTDINEDVEEEPEVVPHSEISISELATELHRLEEVQAVIPNVEVAVEAPSDESSRSSEERETDDDLKQRIKRSSSLKCGKTPPDTPGRKKIVRFADALGLDLADIRTFLEGVPNVPKSAFCDLEVQQEIAAAAAHCSSGGRRSFSAHPGVVQNKRILTPMFQQPGSLPDFIQRVRVEKVCLENLAVGEDLSVRGIVRVVNISYHKSVCIRYTFDHWKNFHEATAAYVTGSHDGFSDRFAFLLWGSFLQHNGALAFCVRFIAKGEQFWDNNRGSNYILKCYSAPHSAAVTAEPGITSLEGRPQNDTVIHHGGGLAREGYQSFMDTPTTPTDPWAARFF